MQIISNINNACRLVIEQGAARSDVSIQRDDITIDGYTSIAEDDIVIPLDQEAPIIRPTQIVLNNPMELYVAILYFQNTINGVDFEKAKIVAKTTALHELDHYEAFNLVGFQGVKFTFAPTNLSPGYDDHFDWAATTLPLLSSRNVTKLGLASVYVAPIDPSGPDVSQALSLGYESVDDIAQRIIVQNARGVEPRLLVPKSYGIDPASIDRGMGLC